MRKLLALSLLGTILCFSCTTSDHQEKKKEEQNTADKEEQKIEKNGLDARLMGIWVNTSLFDSTLQKKQLHPWLDQFYADLILSIDPTDSLSIQGNMDGGKGMIKVTDPFNFSFPDRVDGPVFTYAPEKDILLEKTDNKTIVFRRADQKDKLGIIADEPAFKQFFIDQFFTGYFPADQKANITEIWSGFETHIPFDFDALGIKKKNGEMDFYAWKFSGDTLKLFETSVIYDEQSGFASYKIGKQKEALIKK